jgi:diguanylate cyclase (GGDEF)-like protein/PAS domain S-box-containing protein
MVDPRRSRLALLALALALFCVITGFRFADAHPADAVGFLYVIPVSLLAAEFSVLGAVAGAALATALTAVWAVSAEAYVSPVGYGVRALAMTVVGITVVRLVERSRRASAESDRWFAMSNDLLSTASLDGYYTKVNDAWIDLLGYTREDLLGRPYTDFVHPDDLAQTNATAGGLTSPSVVVGFENRYRARDGSWHWLLWSARSDGAQIYAVAKDITERKRLDREREHLLKRVKQLARTDELTGVANRRAWRDQITIELQRARRSGDPLAVILLDLDRFKSVNDELGHGAGDRLLKDCAQSWAHEIRDTDLLGRVGGDEFAVTLPNCDEVGAADVCARLRPATPEGASASIGFAIWNGGESAEHLIHRADQQLYASKDRAPSRAAR